MMRNLLFKTFILISFASRSQGINWQAWGEQAFKEAKEKRKPIFLDVGTEWCTACNLMEEKTYTDAGVIKLLNENFICIKADAEAQPDLGSRFLEWGWPALIFLDNSGNQLKALQGNRQPPVFKKILNEFLTNYSKGKLTSTTKDYYVVENKENLPVKKLLDKADQQLNSFYDTLYNGWGFNLKIPLYQPIEYSFWQAKIYGSEISFKKATQSLNKYAKTSDRVCGGVYFGCTSEGDWEGAQPEKRSEYQGGVMHNYAEAYAVTKDTKWLDEANLIRNYLLKHMLNKQDSLFYNSQEEYIDLKDLSKTIEPEKYFKLPEQEREKYGQPPIDKTLYTDINFRIVRAFLKLYSVTKDSSNLKIAVDVANRVYKSAYLKTGWYKNVIKNLNETKRMRTLPGDSAQQNILYLKAQCQAALAMLDLYQHTADTFWLEKCQQLRKVVIEKLYDKEYGGFFSTNLMPVSLGGRKTTTKVVYENALFARFLIELGDITDSDEDTKIVTETLNAVGTDKILRNEERLIADYNLAVAKALNHHLIFTVVSTDFNSSETKQLIKLVTSYYHPQKLMKLEKPGHYPDLGKPSLFVCNQNLCSNPLQLNPNIEQQITEFILKQSKAAEN